MATTIGNQRAPGGSRVKLTRTIGTVPKGAIGTTLALKVQHLNGFDLAVRLDQPADPNWDVICVNEEEVEPLVEVPPDTPAVVPPLRRPSGAWPPYIN